ncbi:MAG TPA: dihydroorotate dehydrogenase electron transfer subunit [bacterium]|nr:MAG: Dihydroorotate dehydrogenase B (NAD(+)), electron transfer subunit [bacterium ADurb.Bin270]HPW45484.1 dihydroorotate dehydrogenase electron transfer subunit [bacterium]HQG13172.1 dihydroorotate dehydrogenase electron transfer subunit [bacterium]
MKDERCKISLNEKVSDNLHMMRIRVAWEGFVPGQFVMLSIPGNEVFLRRPFGIAGLSKGELEICYKVVGRGTRLLAEAKRETEIDVLGPCGHGFDISKLESNSTPLLIAGGYGIAPIFGLASLLRENGYSPHLFYGGKSRSDLFYIDQLDEIGVAVHLSTEDGSLGRCGLITELLCAELVSFYSPSIFACGPEGLLKAVAAISKKNSLPAQVSTERYMGCGIGVCLGCVCKDVSGGYVRTCREGPVFDVNDLMWDNG